MLKDDIIKCAVSGQLPQVDMTCPERALYYTLKDVYDNYRKGLINKAQGEAQKNKALRQYDLDCGAFTSAMRILRDNAKLWQQIELAANHYRLERSLDNADAFIEAVYNVNIKTMAAEIAEGSLSNDN